jgi:hypothetical protein
MTLRLQLGRGNTPAYHTYEGRPRSSGVVVWEGNCATGL